MKPLLSSWLDDIRTSKFNHVHHAGNSSGVVDGAAALVLSSKDYADKAGWKPRARIKAMATVAVTPH